MLQNTDRVPKVGREMKSRSKKAERCCVLVLTDKLGKYQEDPINKKNMTVAHSVTGGLCQQGTGLKAENPKHTLQV